MMEIWQRQILWWGYVHPHNHPIPNWKSRGFPNTYPYPYPVNTGISRQNGDGFGQYPQRRIYLPSLTVTHFYYILNTDSLLIFFIVLSWTLKIHFIDILNIFLIYFKTLNLVVISVLWRHSKRTTHKNPTKNLNLSSILSKSSTRIFPTFQPD